MARACVRAEFDDQAGPLVLRLPFQGRSRHAGLPRARRAVAAHSASFWAGSASRDAAGRLVLAKSNSSDQVLPTVKRVIYGVDLKRVFKSKLVLGIADGWLEADGTRIYEAKDMRVGLFRPSRHHGLRPWVVPFRLAAAQPHPGLRMKREYEG